jgi:hypothetical protein
MATSIFPTQVYTDEVKSINDLHRAPFDGSTNALTNWDINVGEPFLVSAEFPYASTTSGLVTNGVLDAWTNLVPDGWGTYFVGNAYIQEVASGAGSACRIVSQDGERATIEQQILTVGHKYHMEVTVVANTSSGSISQNELRVSHNSGGSSSGNSHALVGSQNPGTYGTNFTAVGEWFQLRTISGGAQNITVDNVRVWEYLDYLGGRPNRIGELHLVQPTNPTGAKYLTFTEPKNHQSVVVRDSAVTVKRWSENLSVWENYRTLPQRVLDGQMVWAQFDEDGIYDFWAKLLGLMYSQHMSDTRRVSSFLDPTAVPVEHLAHLAFTFGSGQTSDLDVTSPDPDKKQLRTVLRRLLGQHRKSGLDQGIRDALLNLGYQGYAQEVWHHPVDPGSNPPYERPIGYKDSNFVTVFLAWLAANQTGTAPEYWPTSGLSIHVNQLDGEPLPVIGVEDKKRIARYLKRMVLPAQVYIRYFVTDYSVEDAVSITEP